jgi:class 3 adenylate cyclase
MARSGFVELGLTEYAVVSGTVLFVDMVGFTSFCAKSTPLDVIRMLSTLLGILSDEVRGHGGRIEKILGDGLMAVFCERNNGFTSDASAVRCAMAMQQAVSLWNETENRQTEYAVRIAIGIHAGDIIVGMLGGADLLEQTVFGDTVNVASRVEGKNRCLDTEILITSAVIQGLDTEVEAGIRDKFTDFGSQQLRGRVDRVRLYGVPREN